MTPSTVRIRMYKQGLGDCFLITFPRSDGSSCHILIDCGAVTGSDPKKVVAAAQDIFETTGGHLDLVVGTHEHWDHLSGFNQARDLFDKFSIQNIWLGWTEDPNDPQAQAMVKDRNAKVAALRSAVTRMNATDSAQADSIRQILNFFGDATASDAEGLGAAGGRALSTTSEAIRYLRTRAGAQVRYCNPTKDPPHTLDGVDNVRVYALGPPTDPKLLKQDLPTKKGRETYGLTARLASDSFLAAITPAAVEDPAPYALTLIQPQAFPFDEYYRVSLTEAQSPLADEFYRTHYGFSSRDPENWRRIDTDWLGMTGELALNLDSDTNNTSLVLAFELGDPGNGKVLLFAADAQVGNWLSWGKLNWSVKTPGNPTVTINAHDLLNRTVLYKVGHHGSHNATLSDQGLELMTSSELVAMIPVVQTMAAQKHWDAMPFDVLVTALKKKTRGRVMRIDNGLPQREDAAELSDNEWKDFTQRAVETPLYIEFSQPF